MFDHAGNLLHASEREISQPAGANPRERERHREAARNQRLEELGYQSASIKVKRFQFADGMGIYPFNWWAECFDGQHQSQRPGLEELVEGWLKDGQYRFNFVGDDAWFDRNGEVTDT